MSARPAEALYVIAKAPRPGFAKTRLGRTIGHEPAIALYRAFLCDLAARFSGSGYEPGWYVTPAGALPELRPLIGHPERVLFQGEGDLTERQRELFRVAGERGEDRVVLVASDSPQLPVETVERAFRSLDRADLVLGPTYDGGYYLIGLRDPLAALACGVLGGVPMSTGTELEGLTSEARLRGLCVERLDPIFDVDVEEDLQHLRRVAERPDLPATRAALESLDLLHEPGAVAGESRAEREDTG
jgi:uncharacterized protein